MTGLLVAGDLMELSLADEVSYRGGAHHHFNRRDPAAGFPFQEGLGQNGLQGFRQLCADLCLLLRRERVDDAVDRLGRAGGVERSQHQVTGLLGGQGQTDRLQVAHLADEDHVRVFAQG